MSMEKARMVCPAELRTPLTLIIGPLEDILAEKGELTAAMQRRLVLVLRHTRRLHTLVNSLLDFARLEAGRYLAPLRPVDLGAVTEDLASLFRSAIERGKVELVVNCAEDERRVYIDEGAWEKIVTNIISNAFKYW